ncbi:MAG: helix-hairpin-helix domain-containing protein [Deltaproteobacteria bacterium]|nr:helix-hairpin-helix domain-containing protein [Deltaproteobacteria bacterium]
MTDETAPASLPSFDPVPPLAASLGLAPGSVASVLALLDEGNTVPFIARYRKERTGNLDEVQIRAIEERRDYLVELETRRAAILASVAEQGKLTPELEGKLRATDNKSELEDLYAPYRPRRKTRASVAREKGLEPLALRILSQAPEGDPVEETRAILTPGLESPEEALAGARDIVAETIADTAEVRAFVRHEYSEHGELISEVVPNKDKEPTKFEQYYAFKEAVKAIPSHRFLAIRRGEAEGVLRAHVAVDTAKVNAGIERLVKLDPTSPWAEQLRLAVADGLKRLLAPSVENDVRAELKQRSDHAAVEIFAGNLRNLMLAAPLGSASVIGVDPGLRTGCKCAAIDATGKFLGTVTVYLPLGITHGDAQLAKANAEFLAFVQLHKPRAIAVGNGTGGREAEAFVKKTLGDAGLREGPDAPFVVQVNEAGASVYSASDLAREEFPELDLTIRGAISIARRLQDPLAELVKIEPKSIGVGQYQHDVHQPLLGKKLGDVVESCVNHVGVELNTASAQLLGYIAGIGKSLAKKIVLHRDSNGRFGSRAQLTEVAGLGPKAFEQAAGFLRIADATHPLDRSAVHPERYPLVEQMATDLGVALPELIGNQELVDKLDFSKYISDDVGEPTLRDIAGELAKPGRDPRAEFEPPKFRDDVTSMEDLKPGMVLEGIVTNVTAFGAFVDIGVHNDGLVHVSQLAEQFVKDPSEVVKVGQKLTVRVLEVDNQRKRIALSAKRGGQPQQRGPRGEQGQGQGQNQAGPNQGQGGNRGNRGGRGRGGGNPQQQQHAQSGGGGNPQQQHAQGGGGGQPQQPGQGRRDDRRGPPQGDQRGRGPRGQGQGDQRARGPQDQGQQGPQSDQQRGYQDQRGPHDEQRSYDQRGPQPDQRDPQHAQGDQRSQGDQAGPQGVQQGQRGPQGDRPPGQRQTREWRGGQAGGGGAPHDQRGPGGPMQGESRGPGGPPGDPRARDDRGPRRDDRGGPGPRRDDRGPRRDDRGAPPRHDERPAEPPSNWGVAGFKNNPFTKLVGDDKPKRS